MLFIKVHLLLLQYLPPILPRPGINSSISLSLKKKENERVPYALFQQDKLLPGHVHDRRQPKIHTVLFTHITYKHVDTAPDPAPDRIAIIILFCMALHNILQLRKL